MRCARTRACHRISRSSPNVGSARPYAIAVRMNPHLRRTVAGIGRWTPLLAVSEAAETNRIAYGWQAPRRLVVVRETIRERPEARGRKTARGPRLYLPRLSHHPQA